MIDYISNLLSTVVLWAETTPPWAVAMLSGVLIGSLSTQWIKRTFPVTVVLNCSAETAVIILRSMAFLFSALPTYFLWPESSASFFRGGAFWAALFIGFATPTLYKLFTFFLYRRFPQLEERLSGTPETK